MRLLHVGEDLTGNHLDKSNLAPTTLYPSALWIQKVDPQAEDAQLNFVAIFYQGRFKGIEALVIDIRAVGATHIYDLHTAVIGQA